MATDDFIFDDQIPVTAPIGSFPTHGSEKLMVVIFVVDCSKSMEENGRIQAVNAALHELKFRLSEIKSNNNLDLKIAIMGFTSSAKWELALTPIDEVVLNSISVRAGLTEYGVVFRELNRVLSKDGFMNHVGKKAAPVIIFLTDGEPTDDYLPDLEKLMKNGWFSCANRSAILMGDAFSNDIAKNAVEKFVSNPHTDVVSADDTTVVTEKITAATIHTVAGDPLKGTVANDQPTPPDPPFGNDSSMGSSIPIDPFGNSTSVDPLMPSDPFGNSTSVDPSIPSDPFGNSASVDPYMPTDPFGNNGGIDPLNGSNLLDPAFQSDPIASDGTTSGDVGNDALSNDSNTSPFSDALFDPLFPTDPSIASDSTGFPFPDDLNSPDSFS